MEAFAAVQVVSSIVQLVEFGSNCLAKGLQLYHSSSGALEENLAIEATATHLNTLNDAVKTSAVSVADQSLKDLCNRVTITAAELLTALGKLKVQGSQIRWKCMRKAFKSVWGKEKLANVEDRLASFRSELNLHVCVSIKTKLENIGTQAKTRFDQCNARTKEVLNALTNNGDLFASTLQDHTVLLQGLEEDIRRSLHNSQAIIERDVQESAVHTEAMIKDEHHQTRTIIRNEGERTVQANAGYVQTVDAHLQNSIDIRAQENKSQHRQTQKYMTDLQDQLSQLREQITERDREFRTILEALKEATTAKKRKSLHERSNAVAATLLALQIMYGHVKVMLEALNMKVTDWAEWSRAWSESRRAESSLHIKLSVRPNQGHVDPYKLHGEYFGNRLTHEYPWLATRRALIDSNVLYRKWYISETQANFQDGRFNVSMDFNEVWLLTIVNAALVRTFHGSDTAFDLLLVALFGPHLNNGMPMESPSNFLLYGIHDSQVSNHLSPENLKETHLTLKDSLEYLTTFAGLRDMLNKSKCSALGTESSGQFGFEALSMEEKDDVNRLLDWLIGKKDSLWIQTETELQLQANSTAGYLVDDLISVGLQISLGAAQKSLMLDDHCNQEIVGVRCKPPQSLARSAQGRPTPLRPVPRPTPPFVPPAFLKPNPKEFERPNADATHWTRPRGTSYIDYRSDRG